jgi:hypothetical protein
VPVLVPHSDGHDEHGTEVRGVRGEVEIKEQSVRATAVSRIITGSQNAARLG